jgi:hypothetical protein
VSVLLFGVSCGEPTLDTESAEAQLLTRLRKADGPAIASVSCPDEVVVEQGARFSCTATEEGGTTWTVEVVQLNDRGRLDYRIVADAAA